MIELTKRQREILCTLIKADDYMTLDTLAETFNVSKRTIQNDLNYIELNNITLIKKPSHGIKIDGDIEKYKELISDSENRFLDKNERIDYIIIHLLNDNNTTYLKIAEELRVSRQTIINDFDMVIERLHEFKLNVFINKSTGIKLDGSEINIRNAYIHFAFKYDLKHTGSDVGFGLLNELKEKMNFDFADYDKTLNIVDYCLKRIDNNCLVNEIVKSATINEEYNSIILRYVNNRNESHYIGNLILNERVNQLTKLSSIEIDEEAQDITDYLIKSLMRYQPIADLEGLEYFTSGLIQHIRCALYRIRNKIVVKNELVDQIRYTMPVLYAFTAKKLNKMEKKYGVEFDDSEISFITMYLATIYEENNHRKELNILLVCSYGIASSGILKSRLISKIPGINIIGPMEVNKYKDYIKNNNVDMIITTINIDFDEVPTVVIKPLIDNNDILEINNKIDELFFGKMSYQLVNQNEDEYHSLKEYLNKDTLIICEGNIYWRNAISLAAKPLFDKGLINQHYIDEMINAVDKYGTYMILTENTAFVHAGKEDGIKKNCISMMALKQRIDFGDNNSKKINNIVVLGIKDQNETELLNVVSILGKEENIELLKSGDFDMETILDMHN